MKIEDYGNFYHVDISTQINNKWKNDSVLGIVKNDFRYSIKIKGRDKELIKKKFIAKEQSRSSNRHNRRIIALIYSYLLYKILSECPQAKLLLLCRDVRPERFVMHYLEKIANSLGNGEILKREIRFRKRIEFETIDKLPKSLAGKYVKKVYQGKVAPNKILDELEIGELIEILGRLY
jgi:hypothetical protein